MFGQSRYIPHVRHRLICGRLDKMYYSNSDYRKRSSIRLKSVEKPGIKVIDIIIA